ncbi:unnamed protein product, partial [Rotaria socialis]
MGEYSKALSYLEKTLSIKQKSLPSTHPSIKNSIPVSSTCYDDPTKDHSEQAASTVVPNNQTHAKEILLKLCDELRLNLTLTTGRARINPDDITPE